MTTKQTYFEKETQCRMLFDSLGPCYHIWTNENFEVIFTSEEEFKAGMNIFALCCLLRPKVRILTFVLMSNHIHIVLAGNLEDILELIELFKHHLSRYMKAHNRFINWDHFMPNNRVLSSLEDIRNVIIYNNRNGFVVSRDCTPFSYQWGANRYYYSPDSKQLSILGGKKMCVKAMREVMCSRVVDALSEVVWSEGVICPIKYCDISNGERLFQDASHYFDKLSKNMESNKAIAKEIGESIFYSDGELFSLLCRTCKERFGNSIPGSIQPEAKIEMAKMLRYEYNASSKQIQRMLKLQPQILASLGL